MAKHILGRVAVAAAIAAVLGTAAAQAWGTPRLNYLTFSGTVALPHAVLPGGTYIFEVVNPSGGADVVRVATRDGRNVFLGLTHRVERPRGSKSAAAVSFGEAPAGTPPPIRVWYPEGAGLGHRFVYPAGR